MSLLSILGLGFLLGMRHATDPDHVVAVSTIVARTKKLGTAWLLGAVWGLGHTVTIFLVGVAIILFKVSIPPRIGLSMEFCVGLVLIALGILNVAGYGLGSLGLKTHRHAHDPRDPEHSHLLLEPAKDAHGHSHPHVHEADLGWLTRHARRAGLFQLARSGAVGLVHGLAGSAAVALLVLAAIPGPREAVLYLLIFGLGTLVGMLLLSTLMELCMAYLARWWKWAEWGLTAGTGLLSLAFGLYLVYQLGFVDGLFTGHPQWTPR